ncbi:MAG TPA: hypothetical protein VFC18_05860 [Burkholderiales bacterium]|nr:hypothetical protein [Burkholderiales bacterium]
MRARAAAVLTAAFALAWIAPLVGLLAAGESLAPFLGFPPRTEPVTHAPFSPAAFALLALPALGAVALFLISLRPAQAPPAPRSSFPRWGWIGLALMAAGWVAAWNDVLPVEWRRQAFTPLWVGYALLMCALAYRRGGRSLLTHRTGWFVALFPVSAAFWWLFEHLNQFADNWSYEGIEAPGSWEYFLQGTLPFSTVLPAVAATLFWLREYPRLEALRLPPMRGGPALGWLALLAGALVLAALGPWPEAFFWSLWVGPLLLLGGLQKLILGQTLFAPLATGDARSLLQPALAALVCGFFWELWNFGALAKWHYSIPFAQRFHLFEMPLLGYAGYLPFGIVCALVMDTLARLLERRGLYG